MGSNVPGANVPGLGDPPSRVCLWAHPWWPQSFRTQIGSRLSSQPSHSFLCSAVHTAASQPPAQLGTLRNERSQKCSIHYFMYPRCWPRTCLNT